ncbi:MAG: UDP-N-acetylmuramoyl-L-alanyl-D-glutamate--2,6-diaminopimelate ligase [Rickettsiales bacterium]|nr:UDP-N-acetylmuramoyl-L-alanyl-D-glutamate--2,6-diaminopimelate ligase [Rickettsiales bacterium]
MQSNINKIYLNDLIGQLGIKPFDKADDFLIQSISLDSNKCFEQDVFIAIQGSSHHGIEFFAEAIKNGCKYCITSKISNDLPKESQILIPNLESKLAQLCNIYFGEQRPNKILAVTGTNGKSSIVDLIYQIALIFDLSCNSLGTVGFKNENGELKQIGLTSPDILSFYKFKTEAALNDVDIFAFEASSHGLDQSRIGDIHVDAAIFTNLTLDHLDYHKTMENYFLAKKLLFSKHCQDDALKIINIDDDYGLRLSKELTSNNLFRISQSQKAEINYNMVSKEEFRLKILDQEFYIKHHFVTKFQILNYISAIAYFVIEHGISLDNFIDIAKNLKPTKGRVELFNITKIGAKVIIDFAHTPDAMQNILTDLKAQTQNRLITVFGCGGDRDKSKRSIMGNIAATLSDIAIVTDDNPRYENPSAIRKEIINDNQNLIEVAGRLDAINYGLKLLNTGDVLVVLGKGHEEYQLINGEKIDFSESAIIKNFLKENK